MSSVTLRNLSKAYGDNLISKNVDLDINEGEFVVFVGPSGCGKSTLLRCIAGLEDITSGELYIGDKLMNEVPPSERGVGMVFQSYALYPHLDLFDNMSFGLKLAKADKGEIQKRVDNAGGQRQRVAIGRTLVSQPKVFLLDEPLSNLDAALRVQMRIEIAKLHKQLGCTMIYVTHDQVEAMTMAQKIVVLDKGWVSQVGKPLELYHYPKNRFVAGFIGSPKMNFMEVKIEVAEKERVMVQLGNGQSMWLPISGTTVNQGEQMTLGVRPEHLVHYEDGDAYIDGTISVIEKLGYETQVYLKVADVAEDFIYRRPDTLDVDAGSRYRIGIPAHRCHLFHADGQACQRLYKETGV